MLAFTIYPLIYSLNVSFQEYELVAEEESHYVGLENYRAVLFGPFSIFQESLKVTIIFAIVAVTAEFLIGLGLALLLSGEIRGRSIIRSSIILPLAVSPVIVGLMWRFMYNEEFGIINYFLSVFGLPSRAWLGQSLTALPAVIIVDIWHWTPFMFLILLTGVLALPKEPYESAQIDGASTWQIFKTVTLPLLRPVMLVALVFRTIDIFKIFDEIYVLTWGGPGTATEVLSMYIYRIGFKYFHIGQAAALSWIFLIIVTAIATVYVRLLSKG